MGDLGEPSAEPRPEAEQFNDVASIALRSAFLLELDSGPAVVGTAPTADEVACVRLMGSLELFPVVLE
jgi:hypothetical protein